MSKATPAARQKFVPAGRTAGKGAAVITDRIYRLARHWSFLGRQMRKVVRRLPHRVRQVTRFGQRLLLDPVEMHGFYLYYEREYDDYIFHFLASRLARYQRVLDVGANIGIYTVFLASRCRQVDAFEPEARVLPRLRDNLRLNQLHNVTVHEQCVADHTGEIRFVSPEPQNEGVGHVGQTGRPVPCVALDDFLRNATPEPLLVKMDIEGGEWLALQGARKWLSAWNAPIALLIEVHPEEIVQLDGTVEELRAMLAKAGLTISALEPSGLRECDNKHTRYWWATKD
jgi:FkbM family methyltransferase